MPLPSSSVRTVLLAAPFVAAAALALAAGPSLAPLVEPPFTACEAPTGGAAPPPAVARHVVLISVDGLRPDAIAALGPAGAPALYRFRSEGATTDNARTEYSSSVTMPNHVTQLTGRGLEGPCGHHWGSNGTPEDGVTLHTSRGRYVASVFDVAHDHGLHTAVFVSKGKFSVLETSYGPAHGAADTVGADDGRGKIDRYVFDQETEALVDGFIDELVSGRVGFGFLHLRDPDNKGHSSGWDLTPGRPYLGAVQKIDRLLGRVLEAISSDPALRGTTTVILTSDHGGSGGRRPGHGDARAAANYTIPFYVWGAGAEAGADLYALNAGTRRDPGTGRPSYRAVSQPVRSGDAANLALDLLGLPRVPGAHINTAAAPLSVRSERAEV